MKKFLSVFMALVMMFTMAVPVFAGGDEPEVPVADTGVDIVGMIIDAISDVFNSIIEYFKNLFGIKDEVAYYTITYLDADGTVYGKANVAAGSKIPTPPIPEKAGYVFMNWYPAIPEIMPEKDITVVAQWAEAI